MTIQEELLREIIEILKGFTIVGAVMLACMYFMFAVAVTYLIINERRKLEKHKKNTSDEQPAVDKKFIEVTDHNQNKKFLLPVNRICFIRKRGDCCAVINFEMSATNRECIGLIQKISDVETVETYSEVVAKIKEAIK